MSCARAAVVTHGAVSRTAAAMAAREKRRGSVSMQVSFPRARCDPVGGQRELANYRAMRKLSKPIAMLPAMTRRRFLAIAALGPPLALASCGSAPAAHAA